MPLAVGKAPALSTSPKPLQAIFRVMHSLNPMSHPERLAIVSKAATRTYRGFLYRAEARFVFFCTLSQKPSGRHSTQNQD